MASVELIHIQKSLDDTLVIPDLTLEVEDGELLVLVGPSGCGKSTCLRMIAGLETPTSGMIRIGNREVTSLAPRDRDIGMVFQSYALYPHLSVFENMAFALKLRKIAPAEIKERVEEVARTLELTELLQRKPGALSGGQRQRVAMGRAIVRRPQLFLFDEPLSNLDAALRTQMRSELASMHRRYGTTSIYVTHDQVEAMTLGTRIAVLDRGVLQQVAPPMELYRRPANRFVAGFIGSPAMNFLTGGVTSSERGSELAVGSTKVVLPKRLSPLLGEQTELTLGIRPHEIHVDRGGLEAMVDMVEPMGSEAYVHCVLAGQSLVVRVEGERARTIRAGDALELMLPQERMYVFDQSGDTLVHAQLSPDVRAVG